MKKSIRNIMLNTCKPSPSNRVRINFKIDMLNTKVINRVMEGLRQKDQKAETDILT